MGHPIIQAQFGFKSNDEFPLFGIFSVPYGIAIEQPPDYPPAHRLEITDMVAEDLQLNSDWDCRKHKSVIPVPGTGRIVQFLRDGRDSYRMIYNNPQDNKTYVIRGDRYEVGVALAIFQVEKNWGGVNGLIFHITTAGNVEI